MKDFKIVPLIIISCIFVLASAVGCGRNKSDRYEIPTMIFQSGSYPQAVKSGSTYYYMMPDKRPGHMSIYAASSPDSLSKVSPVTVWETNDSDFQNIWSPELHKIGKNWYIYFEADNGNTDNHHIYVLENESGDPLTRNWQLRGPILVNDDWNYGIHPSTFTVAGRQYLIWSGWEKRRTEVETQCIFIAELENPWTLKSERVMISSPVFEWERQWINPNGSRSAYPIFVNENPEPYISPDGKRVIINYSASGIWTVYSTLGMLSASVSDDMLDPKSWIKSEEPVFTANENSKYGGVSNITLVPSADNKGTIVIFQTKEFEGSENLNDAIMMKEISWENSLPVFGTY